MIESKFLKKEDLNAETGNLVTITGLEQENVALADAEEELKWCMRFKEFKKPLVMNSTNIQLTVKALGTDETEDWPDKKIVLYVDDNVSFGGKLVGGIRIRKARAPTQREPIAGALKKPSLEEANRAIDEIEDDIPF